MAVHYAIFPIQYSLNLLTISLTCVTATTILNPATYPVTIPFSTNSLINEATTKQVKPVDVPHFVTVEVQTQKRPITNLTTFALNKSVWFQIVLPSLQVELVLMFNSSARNGTPIFDVKGTFCRINESKSLFVGLKGPVSKMFSRKDLLSLKALTDCNASKTEDKATFYLNAIPTVNIDDATGTLYTFLLHNQTAPEDKTQTPKQIIVTKFQQNQPHSIEATQSTQRQANQLIQKRAKRENKITQTFETSFEKLHTFFEQPDKLQITLVQNGSLRDDCNGTVQFNTSCSKLAQQSIEKGKLEIEVLKMFDSCNQTNSVHIIANTSCLSPTNSLELQITNLMTEPTKRWYQKQFFIKWLPIIVCVFFVLWVCCCYVSLLKHKRSQVIRHTFQRNTALQRTNSDPSPEVVAQTRWD